MRYDVYQQGRPEPINGKTCAVGLVKPGAVVRAKEWAACIKKVGTVEATSPEQAISKAKRAALFQNALGLARFPIVAPTVDYARYEEKTARHVAAAQQGAL